MKTLSKLNLTALLLGLVFSSSAFAQQIVIDQYRSTGKEGLNVFENPKTEDTPFEGLRVRIGGDFALELQGIRQSNDLNDLVDLETNFNLPTANLNLDVQLARGMRMHLRTFLSARHHNEAWVKGGHMEINNLDFISEDFMSSLMQYVQIRVGLDEINYGDAHFKRSDNARAIYNPLVGSFIMDTYTTEAFMEGTFQMNGIVGVLGVSNGKLNQNTLVTDKTDNKLSLYGKVGYDKQLSDDLRVRLTGSFYRNHGLSTGGYLYGGDRAGDKYYNFGISQSDLAGGASATSKFANARFNPRFKQLTALQFAGFVKFQGIESFTLVDIAANSKDEGEGKYTQIAEELVYRIGEKENFYVAARYNKVSGKSKSDASDQNITRMNFGGGWFMSSNVLAKVEYVKQTHDGAGWTGSWAGAEFSGFMVEASISF